MQRTQISILLFLVVALMTGCGKKQETHTVVTGKVTERNTDTPLQGALVKLVSLAHYTYNTIETIEDTVRTDAQGNYRIETDVHTDKDLMLYGTDLHQYYPQDDTDFLKKNVTRGKSQSLDFSMVPFGWIRIICINSAGNDAIHFNRLPGSPDTYSAYSEKEIIAKTYGNSEVEIYFFIDKNGQQVDQGVQHVNTLGHDTVDIDIHF